MIRFSPGSTIDMFTHDFMPIFLNVSTWSNRNALPVMVVEIKQPKGTDTMPPRHSLAMCLFPVAVEYDNAQHLCEYLKNTMPGDFEVFRQECYVWVNKLVKQPRTAAKEGEPSCSVTTPPGR